MRLFRRWPELRCLALLALAVQLFASFGHVHIERPGRDVTAIACRTFFTPPAEAPCGPPKHDDLSCAVCLTLNAASTAVISEPPAAAIPVLREARLSLRPSRGITHVIKVAAFDARGPPLPVSI